MSRNKQTNDSIHKLYHEAQKRASLPQPLVKYREAKSLLLLAPNNIIFELFNTVIKEVSADKLLNFIKTNLKIYLDTNWSNKIVQQAIKRLKREQTVDVRAGLVNAPAIKSSTSILSNKSTATRQRSPTISSEKTTAVTGRDGSNVKSVSSSQRSPPVDYKATTSKQTAIDQIYTHIMWRIQTDNVTQITSLLIKLVLDDGYKQGKLKVESFDDVADCFNTWRSQLLIKLYAFGSAPANDQKLILANTTIGDLTKWVANYIDGSEKRQKPDLIRVLSTALRDKTKNCIFITNELVDAITSLETGAIRCVFLVDRFNQYEPLEKMPQFSDQIVRLIKSGKLYVMQSLDCVEFAPDPSNDTCC